MVLILGVLLGFLVGILVSARFLLRAMAAKDLPKMMAELGTVRLLAQSDARRNHAREGSIKLVLGTASLYDPTGQRVYDLTRGLMPVKDHDSPAIEPFCASARTVADAYDDATRDGRHAEVDSGSLDT